MSNTDSPPGSGDLPGLDLAALRGWLDGALPELADGELSASLIAGGRSNLTYAVQDGTNRWVLRRPPLGHVLPTAHDMGREYRVLAALRPGPVPVPTPLAACADPEVIGAPFYLMEFVDGALLRTAEDLAGLGPERATVVAHALIDVLADLHEVDPAEIGLADFGRPAGFLERQVSRWKKQLDASYTRPLPGALELHAALAESIPSDGPPALVHGDYRLDNVLVGADDQIAAVLDWEMATLGDPLTDLGLFLVYWSEIVGTHAALPSGDQLIARYAARRKVDLSRLDWYVAFACFKLAVISEGIHARFAAGQTVGEGFERIGDGVLPLIGRGRALLDRPAP